MNRWLLPAVALLGAAGGAIGALGYDRASGNAEARRYLVAHPEVIGEAVQDLRERDQAAQIAKAGPALVTPLGSAWAGNPRGDVTLVEYFDYNCGYCRASLPTIASLIAHDPKLRVVYRELPVLAPSSRTAAYASLVAARQGRFRAFHAALYGSAPVSEATIADAASRAGVNLAGAQSEADRGQLVRNLETAQRLAMTGTPSWIVGKRVIIGMVPEETLAAAIAAARAGR